MKTLTTVATQLDNYTEILWSLGKHKGALTITLGFESPEKDTPIIAELIAIHHLLIDRKILGAVPKSGNAFNLVVSKGAIRKIINGTADTMYAGQFARFLMGRLQGFNIKVSHSKAGMLQPDEESPNRERLHIEADAIGSYTTSHELIETTAIGKVWVTNHAVLRYQERNPHTSGEDIKQPWNSLIKRLQHSELVITPFNERVRRHKKYKHDGSTEVWSHPSDSMRFVVAVHPNGDKYLVTVFDRDDKHW